jgi:azurin
MEESETMTEDVRTIDITGIDAMKFAVESETEGITVGDAAEGEEDLILLETIEVEPGEEIRIRLTTRSDLPKSAMAHNWVLMVLDADANAYVSEASKAMDEDYMPEALSDQVLFHTEMVGGGETTEVTFNAPDEPGDYEYLCSFPGHYLAGMKGFLVVKGEEEMEESD